MSWNYSLFKETEVTDASPANTDQIQVNAERGASEQSPSIPQSLNSSIRSPANTGQIQVNTVADGGNSHSSIHYRLVVRNPDTVHGPVAFFCPLFTIPRVAIEPRGIIFFCFFCSLFTQSDNSIPRSDLALQNGNQNRQREVATRNGNQKRQKAVSGEGGE